MAQDGSAYVDWIEKKTPSVFFEETTTNRGTQTTWDTRQKCLQNFKALLCLFVVVGLNTAPQGRAIHTLFY